MPFLPRVDGDRLARQLEIGQVEEVPIDDVLRKVDLKDALGLMLPAQIELYAEDAAAYLYQGGDEVDDAGFAMPAKAYRLAAGERRILLVRSSEMSRLAVQRRTTTNGTLVLSDTVAA